MRISVVRVAALKSTSRGAQAAFPPAILAIARNFRHVPAGGITTSVADPENVMGRHAFELS
jgi:hypothetical protein